MASTGSDSEEDASFQEAVSSDEDALECGDRLGGGKVSPSPDPNPNPNPNWDPQAPDTCVVQWPAAAVTLDPFTCSTLVTLVRELTEIEGDEGPPREELDTEALISALVLHLILIFPRPLRRRWSPGW